MRSISTSFTFPLSSVKPLDGLTAYRAFCLEAVRKVLRGSARNRERSPVNGGPLEPFGEVEGLSYLRCRESGSLFLAHLPPAGEWAALLKQVHQFRRSPPSFHSGISQSRVDHVYAPKIEWIEQVLRLQGLPPRRMLEVATLPSEFTPLLKESPAFSGVETADESDLLKGRGPGGTQPAGAAVLLESLDRSPDPKGLLEVVRGRLSEGGLLFLTGLVSSGFDTKVLGIRNRYLFPPDRTNCFSRQGLIGLLGRLGFDLLEVSTPGVLDLEIVRSHLRMDPSIPLSPFERGILDSSPQTQEAFQEFLQQQGLSSFARIVARKIS